MPSISRTTPYRLDDQIDSIPRQASQRYATLFTSDIGNGLTPTQQAALIRLGGAESCLQDRLGRLTAMDAVTIKGIIERLDKRGLIQRSANPDDNRRLLVSLSPAGRAELEVGLVAAREISRQALAPLSPQEQETLRGLLTRLV